MKINEKLSFGPIFRAFKLAIVEKSTKIVLSDRLKRALQSRPVESSFLFGESLMDFLSISDVIQF